jgi:hypothetical protein
VGYRSAVYQLSGAGVGGDSQAAVDALGACAQDQRRVESA